MDVLVCCFAVVFHPEEHAIYDLTRVEPELLIMLPAMTVRAERFTGISSGQYVQAKIEPYHDLPAELVGSGGHYMTALRLVLVSASSIEAFTDSLSTPQNNDISAWFGAAISGQSRARTIATVS